MFLGLIPDTHLLHLQVAVHSFFHRLYAMYPNSTISFLKTFYEYNHDTEADREIKVTVLK